MKIRAELLPVQGIYQATIQLDGTRPLSGREIDAVSQLGDPLVEFGGEFSNTDVTFELPANQRSVPTDLPITQTFDLADYADAALRAQCWLTTMTVRIGDAMANLIGTDVAASSTVQTVGSTPNPTQPNDAPLANWMNI